MKKYFAIVPMLALMVACNNEKSPEMIAVENIRDSLIQVNSERDETINSFIRSMNEIEDNLKTIKEKEKIVTLSADKDTELTQDQKDRINEDIQLIYDLMLNNKKKINELSRKLSSSDIKIAELNKMVERLTQQLEDKNIEINLLKDRLTEMNIEIEVLEQNIDSLAVENVRKDDEIAQKTEELNTAWYVFGTKKELLEHQVITKEGGFVGLGKIVKLMEDFNKEYFTKIDIRELKEIKLNFKKVKIVTTHPGASYSLEGDEIKEKLVIIDYNQFWSASKYLVIMVE